MKVETLRKRLAAMQRRLEREMEAFDKLFPNPLWEGNANATEVTRNLATSISYIELMRGMSDYGLNSEVEFHRNPHPPCS